MLREPSVTPREPSVKPREPSVTPREPSVKSERAQRDSERAQRESKEGRIEFAVDGMMQPFPPQKKEAEVAERGITKAIRSRILHWNQHATIIAGRFGSGKSVALEEALRGMQGVYVHIVKDKDWEKSLFTMSLGLDNLDMLKECPAPGQKAEPGVTPHPRIGHSSNNEGRRDVGDFGCFVFDSLGWQAWICSFHLRQDSVVGQFAGTRRDPKTQPPCFAVLR